MNLWKFIGYQRIGLFSLNYNFSYAVAESNFTNEYIKLRKLCFPGSSSESRLGQGTGQGADIRRETEKGEIQVLCTVQWIAFF